jgi:hypothetical protein
MSSFFKKLDQELDDIAWHLSRTTRKIEKKTRDYVDFDTQSYRSKADDMTKSQIRAGYSHIRQKVMSSKAGIKLGVTSGS